MTEKTVWKKKERKGERKKERKGEKKLDKVKSIFYICILRPVYMIVGGRRYESMRDELFLIFQGSACPDKLAYEFIVAGDILRTLLFF